jgi:hypothetical protein
MLFVTVVAFGTRIAATLRWIALPAVATSRRIGAPATTCGRFAAPVSPSTSTLLIWHFGISRRIHSARKPTARVMKPQKKGRPG